ncbi:MAG TPA: PqqD family protein [Balneolaceae bacterium]|nr:PqqD family protein [Balneolaceae bacterium]
MDKHADYEQNPEIIETDLEDELILLDPATQEMFSLNETGRMVWNELPTSSITEIVTLIKNKFDVSSEIAEQDVNDLISNLSEAGLLISNSESNE